MVRKGTGMKSMGITNMWVGEDSSQRTLGQRPTGASSGVALLVGLCPSLRAARLAFIAALPWLMAATAAASGHGDAAHGGGGHGEAAGGHGAPAVVAYDPTQPRTFELGEIYLRNFRPTHNEIANIRFNLHLVFAPGTSDAVIAELAHWKRRLRDQAITAARSADPRDLAEPGLERMQRIMLLRIQRMKLPQEVIRVYLTDFAVGSG
jgi:hypothetical protein